MPSKVVGPRLKRRQVRAIQYGSRASPAQHPKFLQNLSLYPQTFQLGLFYVCVATPMLPHFTFHVIQHLSMPFFMVGLSFFLFFCLGDGADYTKRKSKKLVLQVFIFRKWGCNQHGWRERVCERMRGILILAQVNAFPLPPQLHSF